MEGWRPHAIKPNHSTEGPAQLLFVSVTTWPSAGGGDGGPLALRLRLGVALALRLEDGAVTRERTYVFRSSYGWMSALCSCLSKGRPVWMVASDLLNTWRWLGGFRLVECNEPRRWQIVLTDRATILRGQLRGRGVRAVDIGNYYPCSLDDLSASFGAPLVPSPLPTQPEPMHVERCLSECRVLQAAFTELLSVQREHDLGVWATTAGGLALRAWRHRFMARAVYPHRCLSALGLERGSLFGGRNECYRLGKIAGPLYHVDVNSLYPTVMRDCQFPRRLDSYVHRPDLDWLGAALVTHTACAHCWVDTDRPYYPVRRPPILRGESKSQGVDNTWHPSMVPGRTYYPVGVFRTYLCGEELRWALARGDVLRVESAALYDRADLFSDYVTIFWGLRQSASNCPALREVYKLYLNSLWGKFAQRAPDKVCTDDVLPPMDQKWGKFWRWDVEKQQSYECQVIAGTVHEEVKGDGSWESFPAVAAHVCAAARVYMQRFKDCVGPGHYFYEDTDSLIVDGQGMDRLLCAGWVAADELGKLKLVGEHEHGEICGQKHYVLDGARTLAGLDRRALADGAGAYESWRTDRVAGCLGARGGETVHAVKESYHLPRASSHGVVGPDGWVQPFRLDQHFTREFTA